MSASRSRKRKQPPRTRGDNRWAPAVAEDHDAPPPDPALFIQAHEADIIRGPRAHAAAHSLEVVYYEELGTLKARAGDGLIQWQGGAHHQTSQLEGDSDEMVSLGQVQDVEQSERDDDQSIWVDRYDARLLLDALPSVSGDEPAHEPSSPGGWSDLPSDAEDTFFLSPNEVQDYRRDKRRRLIDQGREERLRALRAEAEAERDQQPAEEEWGGSDEEPDETQSDLMRRTASHILNSPNPAQLEMRILANHGADRRFAFLKGRWARAWRLAKTHASLEKEHARAQKAQANGSLGGLVGYGGSDSESGSDSDQSRNATEEEVKASIDKPTTGSPHVAEDDDDVKVARRARAKEWAEKRRLMQASSDRGS